MALHRRSALLSLLGLGVVASGCARGERKPATQTPTKLTAMASFSVLGDVIGTIGGDAVAVQSLIGPDRDSHFYDPKPSDVRDLTAANLVFRNGLGYEGWLDRLIEASGYNGPLITASDGITPIIAQGTIPDPHVWQSFANVKVYAANAERALAALAPPLAKNFAANRAKFDQAIDLAFADAKAMLAKVPMSNRLVLVPHNSFRYLGGELGLEFRGLKALSTGGQPSAATIAALIGEVKAAGAAAAFVENIADERLIQELARQSGAKIGGKLYSDALSGPDGPAPTTLAMLNHNVRTIVRALSS